MEADKRQREDVETWVNQMIRYSPQPADLEPLEPDPVYTWDRLMALWFQQEEARHGN